MTSGHSRTKSAGIALKPWSLTFDDESKDVFIWKIGMKDGTSAG